MSEVSNKLKAWLTENKVNAEHLVFDKSVHTVEEAVSTSSEPVERFTKSIVMLTSNNRLIIAVVPAEFRASTDRVRKALSLSERPRVANPEETLEFLGQETGGTSPLNTTATVLIDPKVLEKDWVFVGGGDNRSLTKISIDELKRVVEYKEVRVRK